MILGFLLLLLWTTGTPMLVTVPDAPVDAFVAIPPAMVTVFFLFPGRMEIFFSYFLLNYISDSF